jgi:predicted metal-dependent phosphoesterase TrpH
MLRELSLTASERADLHAHSRWSDGRLLPGDVVAEAARCGLDAIALTDHAEVRGVIPAILAGVAAGVHVIPGVELNTPDGDFLGLFVDCQDDSLAGFLASVRESRVRRVGRILERLRAVGIRLDPETLTKRASPGEPSRYTIADALVDLGAVESADSAFGKFLGRSGVAWVPSDGPGVAEVFCVVCRAGGVVVEAHPQYQLAASGQDPEARYRQLARLGLSGVEVPDHRVSEDLAATIREAAARLDLVEVGGSDFHGDGRSRLGHPSTDGVALARLMERLPSSCAHRSLFKRMAWRSVNLLPAEIPASLAPAAVTLEDPGPERLLGRPAPSKVASIPAAPFVIAGPGVVNRVDEVVAALEQEGVPVVSRWPATDFAAICWDLYDLFESRDPAHNLLRFALDRHLFGTDADRCEILFVRSPPERDLRPLKIRIRHRLGPMTFYRVRWRDRVDTCMTSWIHIPDPDRLALECTRLAAFGVGAPV